MYPTAEQLLPTWWRAVWVILLLGVATVTALRAARTPAPARWWYAAYAVMGASLVVMYGLNPMSTPGFSTPALLVFVVALLGVVALVVATIRQRRASGTTPTAWVIAVVDMVTLAYIQIPAAVRPIVVCILFACYLAVQVILRLTVAVRALRGAPQRSSRTLVDPGGRVAGTPSAGTAPRPARADAVVPIALAVLALGMLYMLSV